MIRGSRARCRSWLQPVKTAGVPYRMTEGNTCYHGGQPGVSDAFASALWAADYSLRVAQAGFAGVNLHGGGEGYYAPITGEPNATKLRPEYYGMQLAQQFAGARFVSASVANAHDVNAYAARRKRRSAGGRRQQIEQSRAGEVRAGAAKATECWKLTAPSLDAKEGVQFARAAIG